MKITRGQLKYLIQEVIKKVGDEYALYPKKGGKRLGTHKTKKAAQKQDAAIQISKSMGENNEIDEFKKSVLLCKYHRNESSDLFEILNLSSYISNKLTNLFYLDKFYYVSPKCSR